MSNEQPSQLARNEPDSQPHPTPTALWEKFFDGSGHINVYERSPVELQQGLYRVYFMGLKDAQAPRSEIATTAKITNTAMVSATAPKEAAKGWPWIEGNLTVPAELIQRCEVFVGSAAYVGIEPKYEDGTDTPNRTNLLKLHGELRALLSPSERPLP
jgi:hypothetical protein